MYRIKLLGVLAALLWMTLALTACGRVVTRPTVAPVTTPIPTATQGPPSLLATPTPDNYTPPPGPTATPTPEPIIHTIEAGENLWTIAALYGVEHDRLRDVNGIENERTLQVGQKLLIPVAGWGGPAPPTPTATATALPAAVENVYFQPSPLGELTVLGEAVNTGSTDIERVVVQVALYDAMDRLLATQTNIAEMDALAPGQRSPFVVRFAEAPQAIDSYQAMVVAAVAAYVGTQHRGLEAVDTTLEQPVTGSAVVSGKVRNPTDISATSVAVIVTLYDPLGRVVGTRNSAVEPPNLPAGGETSFRIQLVTAGPVQTYSIQIQARRQP
ncbi:MAG: FxLYD domain-containing protein [Anaerolineae bacterium]